MGNGQIIMKNVAEGRADSLPDPPYLLLAWPLIGFCPTLQKDLNTGIVTWYNIVSRLRTTPHVSGLESGAGTPLNLTMKLLQQQFLCIFFKSNF